MEDSFTYVNRLNEEVKLKEIKNEVLGDLRNELKIIIENQFKKFYHETSRHKQNNDDHVIVLMKEEMEYLKGYSWKKDKVISNLIGFCKSSSGTLQDNSSPWLPVDTSSENIDFTLDTPPKCFNLNTLSQCMLKKNKDQRRITKKEIYIR